MSTRTGFTFRLIAAGAHLAVSGGLVALALLLIFGVWYPDGLGRLEGVGLIVALLVGVDLILGPTCTLLVASSTKTRTTLYRDLAIIGTAQILAFGYGLYAAFSTRPVFLVAHSGLVQSVAANLVGSAYRAVNRPVPAMPVSGPILVGTRQINEQDAAAIAADERRGGPNLVERTDLHVPWPPPGPQLPRLQTVAELRWSAPLQAAVERTLIDRRIAQEQVVAAPVVARAGDGVLLLWRDGLRPIRFVSVVPWF